MPRQLIEPRPGDKRYVRRKQGKFTKSQDDVGRSLSADRRKKAKTAAKKGEGDRCDRKRRKAKKKKLLALLLFCRRVQQRLRYFSDRSLAVPRVDLGH